MCAAAAAAGPAASGVPAFVGSADQHRRPPSAPPPARVLQVVGYDLIITGNKQLRSLEGLEALTKVDGGLWLANNANLASTAAMESLDHVGALAATSRIFPVLAWQSTAERCSHQAGCMWHPAGLLSNLRAPWPI
jgi:hypothetical protein